MGTSQSSFHYDDDEYNGSHDVILNIPSTVKPRPRIGANSHYQRNHSKNKNESLKSALTADLENMELEKIRKEFEFYKLNIENEMANYNKKEHKLETDNKKLKAELQAMQKTCKRLREERDIAFESERQAHQRAAAIELDRNKIQRQFKVFRESKENELQNLYKSKQDLENKLDLISSSSEGSQKNLKSPSFNDMWSVIDHEINFNCDKSIEADLSLIKTPITKINGPKVNFFNDDIFKEFEYIYEDNRCLVNDFYLINIIFSTNSLSSSIIDEYMRTFYSGLQHLCNKCKKLLNMTFLPLNKISQHYFRNKSFVFHFVYREDFCSIIEFEQMLSKIKKLNTKIIIFVYSSDYNWLLTNNINFIKQSKLFNIIKYETIENINQTVLEYLNMYLNTYKFNDAICLQDDISYWIQLQKEIKDSYLLKSYSFDLKKDLDRIDKQMSCLGPMAPILITGIAGCGKSTLLSKWIENQANNVNSLVLYYFVEDGKSSLAIFPFFVRYIMIKMIKHLDIDVHLPTNTDQLIQDLPKFIDKISSRFSGGIYLVIDSIHLIHNFCKYFDWLLDPLPLDFRIIISINEEFLPKSWKSWPSISMSDIEKPAIKLFLHEDCCNKSKEYILNFINHCNKSHSSLTPLYLNLLKSLFASDFLQLAIDEILYADNVKLLFKSIIEKLNFYFEDLMNQSAIVLKFLSLLNVSHEGLFDFEIREMLSLDNNNYVLICSTLIQFYILKYRMGRLVFSHNQIKCVLENELLTVEKINSSHNTLIVYLNSHGYLDFRNSFEFPRLYAEKENLSNLNECLFNLPLVSNLLKRCQSTEVVANWERLGITPISIVKKYHEIVMNSDNDILILHGINNALVIANFISNYDAICEAMEIVQYCLEILNSSTDPDNPMSGICLQLLGELHDRQKHTSLAELMHRQALDVLQSCLPNSHPAILNVIKQLTALYERNGKANLSAELRKKASSLKFNQKINMFKEFVECKINDLELNYQLLKDDVDMTKYYNQLAQLYFYSENYNESINMLEKCIQLNYFEMTEDKCEYMNNLAAICIMQNQFERAAKYLEEVLIIYQKQYKSGHSLILSTIKNLVSLYNELGKMELSIKYHKMLLNENEQVFGHEHPNIALASANLAVYLSEKGDYESAEVLFKKALSIYSTAEGDNQGRITNTLRNLALLKYHQGNFNEAVLLYSSSYQNL